MQRRILAELTTEAVVSLFFVPKIQLPNRRQALQNAKDLEVETALLRDERAVDHAQEPTTSNKRSREQEGEHDGLADAKEAVVNKRVRIDNGDGDELMAVCDQRAHIGGTGDSEPSALHYTRQTVKGLLAKIQTGAMRYGDLMTISMCRADNDIGFHLGLAKAVSAPTSTRCKVSSSVVAQSLAVTRF